MYKDCYIYPDGISLHKAHWLPYADFFEEGFKNKGVDVKKTSTLSDRDWDPDTLFLTKGLVDYLELKNRGIKNVLVTEGGYLSNQFSSISVKWNGHQGKGNFLNKNSPSDRWYKNQEEKGFYKKWDTSGEYILLILQVPNDTSLRGETVDYQSMLNEIDKLGYPVRIRPHPQAKVAGIQGLKLSSNHTVSDPSKDSIHQDIYDSKGVVTISSNCGVDATLAGKPVIATSDYSMVKELSVKNYESLIDAPEPEGRRQWAYDMAYTEWERQEAIDGEWWDHLKKLYD